MASMSIRQAMEEAHNNYLISINNNKLFEQVRKKSDKMVKDITNRCKKKKNK